MSTPILSKKLLVEEVVRKNREIDLAGNVFLRSNGDFFKSSNQPDTIISGHLKALGLQHLTDHFALKEFGEYEEKGVKQKGYVLAVKDQNSPQAADLVKEYIDARKDYVVSRLQTSDEMRQIAIKKVRHSHPDAFIGLQGKEFFSDPLSIAKISRNELLQGKIESRPLSETIRVSYFNNDGTDSITKGTAAIYELYPAPNSDLSKEQMIAAIESIENTIEQKNHQSQNYDNHEIKNSFSDDHLFDDQGYDNYDPNAYDISNDDKLDFDSSDYNAPVPQNTNSNVRNLSNTGDAENTQTENSQADPKLPKVKTNAPQSQKNNDAEIDSLIDRLTDKNDSGQPSNDQPNEPSNKEGKKNRTEYDSEESQIKIVEAIAQTLAKLAQMILMLIKMLLAMILAAITRQGVIEAAKQVYEDYQNKKPTPTGSVADAENKEALDNSLDKSKQDLENGLGINPQSNDNNGVDLEGGAGNNSPPKAIEFEQPKVLSTDVALAQLSEDKIKETLALGFSPDEAKKLSSDVFVRKAHNIAEGEPDVPESFQYSDKHGALLAIGDKVTTDTLENEGTIIGAYENDNQLYYNLAHLDSEGGISTHSIPAESLTVKEFANPNFKPDHELIASLNESQLKEAGDGISPIELSSAVHPEANTNVFELAQKGVPVSKSVSFDSLEKPVFDDIKSDIAKETKQDSFISAVHTNKTGDLRSEVNVHPLYGELLNINDKVEVNLPVSGSLETGAIVGAYTNDNGDLKYQVKLGDGLVTNVKANDISVLGYNEGGLTEGERIKFAENSKLSAQANFGEKIKQGQNISLAVDGNPAINHHLNVIERNKVKEDFPHLVSGAVKTNPETGAVLGAGVLIKRINDNNKEERFVSLGKFKKELDGVEREFYMAMPVKSNILTPNLNYNKHLYSDQPKFFAVDDPNIQIQANGVTSKNLKAAVDKVSSMLQTSSNKGFDDYLQQNALTDYNEKAKAFHELKSEKIEQASEQNIKTAFAYQQNLSYEKQLAQNLSADVSDLQNNQEIIDAEFVVEVDKANHLAIPNLSQSAAIDNDLDSTSAVNSQQNDDISGMTIPDNQNLIQNEAQDMQDQYIRADYDQFDYEFGNEPVQPTANEPVQPTANEPVQPTANEPVQPTANEPVQPTANEPEIDALGLPLLNHGLHTRHFEKTGYEDLDSRISNLREFALGEYSDSALVSSTDDVREEMMSLQYSTLLAGASVFKHPEVAELSKDISDSAKQFPHAVVTYLNGNAEAESYPNISELKLLASLEHTSPDLNQKVDALINKIASTPELKQAVSEYKELADQTQAYSGYYTNQVAQLLVETTSHESFSSQHFLGNDDLKEFVQKTVHQVSAEVEQLLTSQSNNANAYFLDSVANKGSENIVDTTIEAKACVKHLAEHLQSFETKVQGAVNKLQDPQQRKENTQDNQLSM